MRKKNYYCPDCSDLIVSGNIKTIINVECSRCKKEWFIFYSGLIVSTREAMDILRIICGSVINNIDLIKNLKKSAETIVNILGENNNASTN